MRDGAPSTAAPGRGDGAGGAADASGDFLLDCARIVGPSHVLTSASDTEPHLSDWHRRYVGAARAVVRPATTQEVADIVRLCALHGVPIVPQGGNTGLCGGATPDVSGRAVVLQLGRLNRLRSIDAANGTMTAEAGMILANAQAHAREAGMIFPLSLAAEGSCTIGGNLATNAGGTAVLRYGNARELCLGLEVVTPEGEIWDGLRGLRKDNTGYALKDLYVGSEGTLGIITAAVLKLFPAPSSHSTAFISAASLGDCVRLLQLAQASFGSEVTTFEVMSGSALELVRRQGRLGAAPLPEAPWTVLLELSHGGLDAAPGEDLQAMLETAFERGLVCDAALAASLDQARSLWAWREAISEAQSAYGGVLKHDVSLPISALERFEEQASRLIHERWPQLETVVFGHAGDGNLHFNVRARVAQHSSALPGYRDQVQRLVHDQVASFQGSFSAEHGIGQSKRDELGQRKSGLEITLMRRIKQALDPASLLNPGKLLP